MSSKATPMPDPQEPNGTVQHDNNPRPTSPVVEAGPSAMHSQTTPPAGTISRTRQIPQIDEIEVACDNLNPSVRMLLFERFV